MDMVYPDSNFFAQKQGGINPGGFLFIGPKKKCSENVLGWTRANLGAANPRPSEPECGNSASKGDQVQLLVSKWTWALLGSHCWHAPKWSQVHSSWMFVLLVCSCVKLNAVIKPQLNQKTGRKGHEILGSPKKVGDNVFPPTVVLAHRTFVELYLPCQLCHDGHTRVNQGALGYSHKYTFVPESASE